MIDEDAFDLPWALVAELAAKCCCCSCCWECPCPGCCAGGVCDDMPCRQETSELRGDERDEDNNYDANDGTEGGG